MVDYSFVKFLNKDLDAEGVAGRVPDSHFEAAQGSRAALPAKKDPVELARAVLAAFDVQIAAMHNEASELEIKTDIDFNQAVEMRGQAKTLKKTNNDSVQPMYFAKK